MADATTSYRWTYRGVYLLIFAAIAFVQLLPINPGPGTFPGPDILLLVTFAWIVRRPDLLPTLVVAAVFLLADILFLRPLGLWAAQVVLGVEFLRARAVAWRDMNFVLEWFIVAGVIVVMTVANVLILVIFLVDQPPLGLTIIRLISTVALYPLTVLIAARLLGLRKLAPGAVNRLGHRH